MRIVSLLAGLSMLLLTVTPVAADNKDQDNDRGDNEHHESWKDRGDWNNRDDRDNEERDNNNHGRGTWVSYSNDGRDCGERADRDDDDDDGGNGNGNWGQQVRYGDWNGGCNGGRRGVFKNRYDGLSDDQADALSDVFQDCVSKENLWDLRWGQVWNIVHTVGLSERERRKIHDLGDLADTLHDHLDDNNVEDLKFKQILQVAHACGLSTRDVVYILRSA
jgi:hypothetical protein